MNSTLLKAQEKKNKFFNNNKEQREDDSDDSDASLSSDDEEEVSKGYVNEIFNDKYICLKYLGRGTFSRVWLVLDITNDKFFALKTIFPEYYEDSLHEIKINNIVNSNTDDSYVVKMIDNFLNNKGNKQEMCIVVELLGTTLNELLGEGIIIKESNSDNIYRERDESDESDEIYNAPSISLFKRIMIDIFKGIDEIHSKNIVHTDLKFENIMIDILCPKIKDIIGKFENLKISEYYNKLITESLPLNYSEMDKSKKKRIKRQFKVKALKLLKEFIYIHNEQPSVEPPSVEKYKLSLKDLENIDNFKFKIIDLGNGEFLDNKVQDEIMIRNYRPPENIINEYFDCKADIWSIGCIAYEILTNKYLFKVSRKKKSVERDRSHLHEMYEILGKMPRDMTQNCDFSEQLFDNKGRILKNKKCDYTDIEELLKDESEYTDEEIKELSCFLKKLLDYNTITRYSSKDALNDKWLMNN